MVKMNFMSDFHIGRVRPPTPARTPTPGPARASACAVGCARTSSVRAFASCRTCECRYRSCGEFGRSSVAIPTLERRDPTHERRLVHARASKRRPHVRRVWSHVRAALTVERRTRGLSTCGGTAPQPSLDSSVSDPPASPASSFSRCSRCPTLLLLLSWRRGMHDDVRGRAARVAPCARRFDVAHDWSPFARAARAHMAPCSSHISASRPSLRAVRVLV